MDATAVDRSRAIQKRTRRIVLVVVVAIVGALLALGTWSDSLAVRHRVAGLAD